MTRAVNLYRPTEDQEQEAVVQWCELMGIDVVHVPNEGKRSAAYGAKMKRMGLRSGFPDLFLPYPCKRYHGLFIEMKIEGGKATADQRKWLAKLAGRGYRAVICVGADAAINEINRYFDQIFEGE